LFTGLLINRDSVAHGLQWLHTISFFHAAFEALAVNELRYLQLKEVKVKFNFIVVKIWNADTHVPTKYGVELDVPAATILSVFGLRAQVRHPLHIAKRTDMPKLSCQSFWWPNMSLLGIFFLLFTAASYVQLHFFVKEKR
jgi:hypothetical protein